MGHLNCTDPRLREELESFRTSMAIIDERLVKEVAEM